MVSMEEPKIKQVAKALGLNVIKNKVKCPFHSDNSPSMCLYEDTNRFHCFGCGKNGNVWELIKKVKNVNFQGAIDWVKQSNLNIQTSNKSETKRKLKRKSEGIIYPNLGDIRIYDFLYNQLSLSEKSRDYLRSRSLSDEIINNAEIKSLENPNKIFRKLKEEFSEKELKHSGLLSQTDENRSYFTFYKKGILFFFVHDDIYYIQSRNYNNNPKTTNPKRLTKPLYNTKVFHRSDEIWLCEGIIDALSLIEIGLPAVAMLGTELNEYYTDYFEDKEVYLMLDFDESGQKKTDKLIKQLNPIVKTLSKIENDTLKGNDPNEIISIMMYEEKKHEKQNCCKN